MKSPYFFKSIRFFATTIFMLLWHIQIQATTETKTDAFSSSGGRQSSTHYENVFILGQASPPFATNSANYGEIGGFLAFLGLPDAHTTQTIHFVTGWNWFSVNVVTNDMSLDSMLSSIAPNGNFIKNQTAFATYYGGATGWYSSNGLEAIDNKSLYMIKMDADATLENTGQPADAAAPIPVVTGWNWIGYLPQSANAINDALSSLIPNGNFIKNQTAFATYYGEPVGWYSSNGLDQMLPGEGYMLKMNADDELIYTEPAALLAKKTFLPADTLIPEWKPDIQKYEHSMAITGIVQRGDEEIRDHQVVLGAFSGNECRGRSRLTKFPLNEHFEFAMLVYGNAGDTLTFKLYEQPVDSTADLINRVLFTADAVLGDGLNPEIFTIYEPQLVEIPESYDLYQNYPNPFNPTTTIAYDVPQEANVLLQIFDIRGQLVRQLRNESHAPGSYKIIWDARNELGIPVVTGLYFYTMRSGDFVRTNKMILMK